MKRVVRWLTRLTVALMVLVMLGVTVIYARSESILRRSYEVEGIGVTLPTDAASIAEGQRLARTRGCYGGCHGTGYGGEVFMDEPFPMNLLLGRVVTPALTSLAADRTDSELERSIRHGLDPAGRSVLIMPSEAFAHMSDEDLGKILASIRSEAPSGGLEAERRMGPMARFFILRGLFRVPATIIDHDAAPPARTPTEPDELGEYLAVSVCAECHGLDLGGAPAFGPAPAIPPLAVVTGYTRPQFERLMREGVPASGVNLDLMKEVAVARFSHFNQSEVDGLFAYLGARATWEAR